MSSILDNAIKHFSDGLNGELAKIDIPEWGSAIWFKPVPDMNGAEYTRYLDTVGNGGFDHHVSLLILRSRKEDGTRAFNESNRPDFMNKVKPSVITKIVKEMNDVDEEGNEEVKKS